MLMRPTLGNLFQRPVVSPQGNAHRCVQSVPSLWTPINLLPVMLEFTTLLPALLTSWIGLVLPVLTKWSVILVLPIMMILVWLTYDSVAALCCLHLLSLAA
eukprot:6465441-Amphidinium_carterae.1